MSVALPTDSTLHIGSPVSVVVQPLNVTGSLQNICLADPTTGVTHCNTIDGCTALTDGHTGIGVVCQVSNFAKVTITQGDSAGGGTQTSQNTYDTVAYDVCAQVIAGVQTSDGCATVGLSFSPGTPPPATVGQPYSYQFQGASSLNEGVAYIKSTGQPPPGLTLDSDGLLHGTPTGNGGTTYRFVLTVQGLESKLTTDTLIAIPVASGTPVGNG